MTWLLINFVAIVEQILPSFFRKTKVYAFFNALLRPLQTLSDKTLYQMQHDSRLIYLEKMLNEFLQVPLYDPLRHEATRKVYIIDSYRPMKQYIFKNAESRPLYLGTVYLGKQVNDGGNFVIKIPVSLAFNELRLKAEVDFYKLSGKKYTIETY